MPQARQKITAAYPTSDRPIKLTLDNETAEVTAQELGEQIHVDLAVNQAYQVGRGSPWHPEVVLTASVDQARLSEVVKKTFNF